MSTELFEAKGLADEIHDAARVPQELNDPIIYNRTLEHIETLIKAMDEAGFTMNEQRSRMGKKKDELISELTRLRDSGVLRSGDERQPMSQPLMLHASQINVQRPN